MRGRTVKTGLAHCTSSFMQASQLHRNASSLVIAEHNGETVIPLTYNTITAARQLGEVTALVAGPDCAKVHTFCSLLMSLERSYAVV